jgi:hypothetical protein
MLLGLVAEVVVVSPAGTVVSASSMNMSCGPLLADARSCCSSSPSAIVGGEVFLM